ncbi:hypothetical protein [Cryobacterium sp. Y11]|nr:hypothetical protein [Cryobacterium sp. Y11]
MIEVVTLAVDEAERMLGRSLGVQLDPASPDYARFILHIQFLLQ